MRVIGSLPLEPHGMRFRGKAVTDVTFLDGTALVSAHGYASNAVSPALVLAHGGSGEVASLTRRG